MPSKRVFLGFLSVSVLIVAYFWDLHKPVQLALSTPRVLLRQGTIIGKFLNDGFPEPIEAFLGIPYALPPTGSRRFRPLEELPNSTETIQAKEYGPVCPGKSFRGGQLAYDEDCLTVNIYRPRASKRTRKLPVAIHVHGGAFNRGHGYMHDTASMVAWSKEPFIGVNFNYRIGALGFLPSSMTAKEGVLNLGLRDQIFLFEWVKQSIEEFGGDVDDITVFGLSAGTHAIGHHLLNMNYDPPFKRAILESGAPSARAVHPYDSPLHEQQFHEFLQVAGCSGRPDSEIFPCLRSQPSPVVINASFRIFDKYNPSLRWAFQPVIDGDIIARRPTLSWEHGKWHKMPLMTGFCHNEASSYVSHTTNSSNEFEQFWRTLLPELFAGDRQEVMTLYPDPSTDTASPYVETRPLPQLGSQFKRAEAAYAHYAYVCPVRATAHFASSEQPVYLYHWALNKSVELGANHGDNLPYEAFSRSTRSSSSAPGQKQLARIVHAYWTSFITQSGDPNRLGTDFERPTWEAFRPEKQQLMVFGEGNDELTGGEQVGILAQVRRDDWAVRECHFWWSKAKMIHQ